MYFLFFYEKTSKKIDEKQPQDIQKKSSFPYYFRKNRNLYVIDGRTTEKRAKKI